MSSPAELLAQQHRSASESPVTTADSTQQLDSDSETTTLDNVSFASTKKVSLNDTTAFPSLGKSIGGASTASSSGSSWGKGGNSLASSSNGISSPKTFKPAVKSSTTQLTFVISDDKQKNLTQAERFKILAGIMSDFNVKIESTYSSASQKRTFLLNGKLSNVELARKQILKQITRPTEIEFTIPSKLRSIIIGSKGKTLNPIIQSTGVKIDIEKDSEDGEFTPSNEDEELFGRSIKVNISGDIEGCDDAKAQILKIVNDNSKSLIIKLPIDSKLKPFVNSELSKLETPNDIEITIPGVKSSASNIIISGSRDSILLTRTQIKNLIDSIELNLSTVERQIPKNLHDLLDIDEIFEKTNVIVQIPDEDDKSLNVKFIGLSSNIPKAIDLGRILTSSSTTDSLNLGKSHGSNVEHAKNLASFLTYSKFLEATSTETGVKIKAPSFKALSDSSMGEVLITFTTTKENKDAIKLARKSIVELVNKIPPTYVKTINDIDSFLFPRLDTSVAIEEKVCVIPFGSLANAGNKLILVVQQSDDDEFLPSTEEINSRLNKVEESFSNLKDLSKSLIDETIELESNDQKLLNDQLSILLNKFESNSIEIKLHQNKDGYSENEIYLKGSKSIIKDAIVEITSLIEQIKNYEEASKYNTTIEIPTKCLARFIGQKGSHLNELSADFNVKIDVNNDETEKSENAEVKLTGLKTNVDELIKKIDALIKKWSDEVSTTIRVEQKFHKKLVGPSGIYINRLQDKYNVKINMPREEGKLDVSIRGPSRGVAKVEEEIKMLMDYERENGFKQEIEVSKEALGNIIGRKGETLNDITADTGVDINVEDHTAGAEKVTLTITGSKTGIAEATKTIRAIEKRAVNLITEEFEVDPKWYRNLIGPSGLTKREIVLKAGGDEKDRDFRRLLQFPGINDDSKIVKCEGDKEIVTNIVSRIQELVKEYESITEERVEIAKNLHKYLIGPSGIVKNGVESDFNVKIFIPSKASEQTDIGVKGTPENISKAIEKLQSLIEGKK